MKYRKRRITKYEIVEDTERFDTGILGHFVEIMHKGQVLCLLLPHGLLKVFPGYAWDGPSGPTIDTKAVMRGSAGHDPIYQMMSEGKLPLSCRKAADILLKRTIIESSDKLIADMDAWKRPAAKAWAAIRSRYYYRAVRTFAGRCAATPYDDKIYEAP